MEIIAAVIGSMIGGLIGGLFAWWVANKHTHSGRAWDIALVVSEVQAVVLSASTPSALKSTEDVDRLQADYHVAHRRFYILGQKDAATKVNEHMSKYFKELRRFAEDDINRSQLEDCRRATRDDVAGIMSKFT